MRRGGALRVTVGAFFWILAGMTSAGIALTLYPVLRQHGEGLAIGSVGFRIIEGTLYVVGAVAALLLITLSQQAAAAATSSDRTTGALLLALRDRANLAGILACCVGATMYYFVNEMVLAVWLIVKGLAAQPVAAGQAGASAPLPALQMTSTS